MSITFALLLYIVILFVLLKHHTPAKPTSWQHTHYSDACLVLPFLLSFESAAYHGVCLWGGYDQ